jgi:hypothetical protein
VSDLTLLLLHIPIWAENLLKKWAKVSSRNLRLNQQFNPLPNEDERL